MKLIEVILAGATGGCGVTVIVTSGRYPRACEVASGAGLFLCSIWLMMRTL